MSARNLMDTSVLPYLAHVNPAKPRERGGYTLTTYAKNVLEGYFDEVHAIGNGWHKCIKHYPRGPIRIELPPAEYHNTCVEHDEAPEYISTSGRHKP